MSPELLDDSDEFVGLVALAAGVVEEFFGLFDDGALFWGAGDGDAAAAAELEQAFVAELTEGAEDGVGVDAEDGGDVFCGWESFARLGFAISDGAADLAGDLFVQFERVVAVDLDTQHGVTHTSVILMARHCDRHGAARSPEIEQDRDLERRVAALRGADRGGAQAGATAAQTLRSGGAARRSCRGRCVLRLRSRRGGATSSQSARAGSSDGAASGVAVAAGGWEPSHGPYGGPAYAVATAASATNIAYVGTRNGVFVSKNGGRRWQSAGLAGQKAGGS